MSSLTISKLSSGSNRPGPAKAPEQAPEQPPAPSSAGPDTFRYVYQTASFKDIKRAEELKARIEKLGFASTIEQSAQGTSVWHRVNVIFVGTADETDGLKEKLATLGLGKPLLRSKTSP